MHNSKIKQAFLAAVPYTIPIFAGFTFLGMAYGMYMNVSGFSFWYPLFMSMAIYAGSVEFVGVSLLLAPFNPFNAFLMALMINARSFILWHCTAVTLPKARLEEMVFNLWAL